MGDFRMPSLGADMERGTVVEWRVDVGDVVHRGDIVAVIETEKSTIEVEVFEDGVVGRLVADVGDEVEVGGVLAVIGPAAATVATPEAASASTTAEADTRAATAGEAPARDSGRAEIDPTRNAPTAPKQSAVRSPLIRHLAERTGVDLQNVRGTGAHGIVTRADVERAAAPAVPAVPIPSEPERQPVPAAHTTRVRATPRARALASLAGTDLRTVHGSGPRNEILAADVVAGASAPPVVGPEPQEHVPTETAPAARRRAAVGALMSRSKREIPHYYLSTTIDGNALTGWVATANEQRTVHDRIIPAALLLRATVLAATANPSMNGHCLDGAFHPSDAVHLGVAVSLRGGGLVAPTIQHAEALDLDGLMHRLHDLVGRARSGVLRASEMTEPTITVTNIGEQGVEQLFGVIYPPQVALVGFGAIVPRPWAVDGMLTVRPVVTATLSADHRVSDGHDGARFLATIGRLLQQPETLSPAPSAEPRRPAIHP